MLAGDDPTFCKTNSEIDLELMSDGVESTLQRKAKVHGLLEMWQGSQNQ